MASALDRLCSASGVLSLSQPRMVTLLAMALGSVSRMMPPSINSSMVSRTRSRFSSAARFSTTPLSSRDTASKNAFSTVATMISFSSTCAVTKKCRSAQNLYTTTWWSRSAISASPRALLRWVLVKTSFSNFICCARVFIFWS